MIESLFPHRKFSALLYDFDGTIVDSMPAHLDAWNAALGLYGLALTLEQHRDWAGRPTREIVRLLSEMHGKALSYDEISSAKEIHYFKTLGGIKTILPVVEIIRAYHGKVPQAIVSGSRRRVVEATAKALDLDRYFDFLVCAEDYTHGKPAPDCFLTAATKLDLAPESCLVLEDADLGIAAAHAAGMSCLRVVEHPELGHQISIAQNSPASPRT